MISNAKVRNGSLGRDRNENRSGFAHEDIVFDAGQENRNRIGKRKRSINKNKKYYYDLHVGQRELSRSVSDARHDDDDDNGGGGFVRFSLSSKRQFCFFVFS